MSWVKRFRAALSLGAAGGVLGGFFGTAWWWVTELLDPALSFGSLGFTISVWAGFGALAATGAGLLLTRLGHARNLNELSTMRMVAFGLVAGAAAPFVSLLLVGFPHANASLLAAITGLFGGLVAGGLTRIAKAAPDDLSLEEPDNPSALLPPN